MANALQPGSHGNCDAFISKVSTLGGIAINPAGLVFPAQSVGVTSPQQSVTIANTNDTASVSISSIVISGDFAQTNNCPPVLAAGANCTVNVTFDPTAAGIRKGTNTVSDNAPGSPQIINLTGSTSTLTLSASTLSFGTQTVGLASAAQTVRVTNTGTTTITVSSIAASGDFAETNNCGTSLPAGTNCTISITYTPSAAGQSFGAVTISDNAPRQPAKHIADGYGRWATSGFYDGRHTPAATVPAGSSALLAVTITPVGGFSQLSLGLHGLAGGSELLVLGRSCRAHGADRCSSSRHHRRPHNPAAGDWPRSPKHAGESQADIFRSARTGSAIALGCAFAPAAVDCSFRDGGCADVGVGGMRRRPSRGSGWHTCRVTSGGRGGNLRVAQAFGDHHFAGAIAFNGF